MNSESEAYRRMQIKVLYSFDNSPTVFLSRSKVEHAVRIAQISLPSAEDNEEVITLGALDLKECIQQVVNSSPENFRLQSEDYAVYHKDITEQPDEPFVANGVISSLLNTSKPDLIPGRVCQNLSASVLFGGNSSHSSLTLEIRLKFHVISKSEDSAAPSAPATDTRQQGRTPPSATQHHVNRRKRPLAQSSANAAVKATRTKSLPIFYHPPNQQISNIINADKLNNTPKYDSKRIQERFNSAPFLSAKIIDKPARYRRRSNVPLTPTVQHSRGYSQPQRAMRTRSMMSNLQPVISSPINEELYSEATDDTEYHDDPRCLNDDDENEIENESERRVQEASSSPSGEQETLHKAGENICSVVSSSLVHTDENHFQSLPDLEDLDRKKTHTIPSSKLPPNQEMTCINQNCAASDSVTWRYFEAKTHQSYLNVQRTKIVDMSSFDGMFGPLCNACYLFLRNKGFMRPEAVVKKYLQQQKYKKELKLKEYSTETVARVQNHSSPYESSQSHRFATPSHVPSAINEVIRHQNNSMTKPFNQSIRSPGFSHTPQPNEDYHDLNEFMSQLNSFGGPLTDIDLPNDNNFSSAISGTTPPMVATKSNTRIINFCDDEEKENQAPSKYTDFEQMMIRSFSSKSSPEKNDWTQLFEEPTPKDNVIESSKSSSNIHDRRPHKIDRLKISPNKQGAANMPSSPLLTSSDDKEGPKYPESSSPINKAKRSDTTMSFVNTHRSSPQSEIYEDHKLDMVT